MQVVRYLWQSCRVCAVQARNARTGRGRQFEIHRSGKGLRSMRYLHTMVRIRNIEQSLAFYCDGLGLKEVRRIENKPGARPWGFLP